jgi:hypothetical protein
MVAAFADLPNRPAVWLYLPPPAYGTRYGIQPLVIEEEIIPQIRAVAKAAGIGTIDVHGPLVGHPGCSPTAYIPLPDRVKNTTHVEDVGCSGAPALTRTGDRLLRRQLLFQLSYGCRRPGGVAPGAAASRGWDVPHRERLPSCHLSPPCRPP